MTSNIQPRFWKKKNVLITGYEGFLGTNLTKRLIGYEANIVGLDIKVRRTETILTENDYKNIVVVKGSVASAELLKKLDSRYKFEVVFHLAAEAIVEDCLKNPLKSFSTNIEGTWTLLDICKNSKTIKHIVIASSDKAYGSHKKLPYKENASLIGNHPYDVSKSCADLIASAYSHTYKLPVTITRCGNIYGPGDFNFSRIVPDAIKSALNDKSISIRSDGKFTRDYIFVEDIVDGYILLAEKLQKFNLDGEAFNFSNEDPMTVIELVKQIYNLVGKKPKYKILNQAKYEIKHQYLSSMKARKALGWYPRHGLECGLEKTIEWYRKFVEK